MAQRNLEQARNAYEMGNIEESKSAHSKTGSKPMEKHNTSGGFIKSFVYGGLDGILTTFAIVTGVYGGNLQPSTVVILGISSVIGDGLAMAIGDFVSTKSEQEFQQSEREREEWEVENNPEGEKEEMIDIYTKKGMAEADAIIMTDTLAKNKKVWVDIMMVEELGLIDSDESPFKNGLVTFCSFATMGLVPLLPYIVGAIAHTYNGAFWASLVLTCAMLFFLGAIKTRITGKNWFVSGMETFSMGAVAAGVAFLLGLALQPIAE